MPEGVGFNQQLFEKVICEANRSISVADVRQPDAPLVMVNHAFERVTGYSQAETVGINCRFLQGPDTDAATVSRIKRAVTERKAITETLLNYRKDGTAFWNEVSLSPLRDDDGEVTHMVGVQVDVTDRVEAQQVQQQLYESEQTINQAMRNVNARLEAILGTLPSAVLVVEAPNGRLVNVNPAVARIWRMEFPSTESFDDYNFYVGYHPDGRRYEPKEWPAARALAGEHVEGEEIRIERGDGTTGFVVVRAAPISDAAGNIVAAVALFDDVTERKEWVVRLTAEKERSLALAQVLQRNLLPPALPDNVSGLEFGAAFSPVTQGLDVGGDFYDVFERNDGDWVVSIGDVMGKGAGAATVTSLARHSIRTVALRDNSVTQILSTLNEALLQEGEDQPFCTVSTALVSVSSTAAEVSFSLGGHPQPVVVRADGEVESVGTQGTLLGAFADVDLHESKLSLNKGDSLVFFTDGVTEAIVNGQMLEEAGLREVLRDVATQGLSASDLAEHVQRSAIDPSGTDVKDDIAVMVVKAT